MLCDVFQGLDNISINPFKPIERDTIIMFFPSHKQRECPAAYSFLFQKVVNL